MAQSQLNLPPCPLPSSEKRGSMAKAALRSAENGWTQLGSCMASVQRECRLSLEEFAYALGKDERQIARQMKGEERPQIEAVYAVEKFRGPLVVAMASHAEDIEITTEIRIRRPA